jgi:formylglycine-generating enzyme required for sulfatase activity
MLRPRWNEAIAPFVNPCREKVGGYMHRLLVLAALFVAVPVRAATLDLVDITSPNNTPDSTSNCFSTLCGAVAYEYSIGRYEVTNAQYAEFLNAVADADPNNLYNASMDSDALGGITRGGAPGGYFYGVKSGRGNNPVIFVSFYDALRFANWLHNAQPAGAQGQSTTENGAYTITPNGVAANSITRNPGARFFLPTEDEWYKAAFYDAGLDVYYDFPMGSNSTPFSDPPPGTDQSGNFWSSTYALTGSSSRDYQFNYLSDVGAYTSASSPFGTFDQGGNVYEWNETVTTTPSYRGLRGGSWDDQESYLFAANHLEQNPANEFNEWGFRIAPEPSQLLIAATAVLTLAAERKRRRPSR